MPEYLSPGVYVEEFDSGVKAMEGVGTSTAGFVGMAERGPVVGAPEFITSFAEYQRKFGGYLSANAYEGYRFLPYAVEQFFLNGGARCFIMRVAPEDAKPAASSDAASALKIYAANPGQWGNKLKVIFRKASKAKTQILAVEGNKFQLKSVAGFNEGDTVCFSEGENRIYNRIVKVMDKMVEFKEPFDPEQVVDTSIVPTKVLTTCEVNLEVVYDDVVEKYEQAGLNVTASNYILNKIQKSELIRIEVTPQESIMHPIAAILGEDVESGKIELAGGSDGSLSKVNPSTFIGEDKGPGARTGLQSFIENDVVSIMAIPGITDPAVQLALVAHCENLASRFAVLDVPIDTVKVTDVAVHRSIVDSSYAAMYHPWVQVLMP